MSEPRQFLVSTFDKILSWSFQDFQEALILTFSEAFEGVRDNFNANLLLICFASLVFIYFLYSLRVNWKDSWRAQNLKVAIDWNRECPNRVGGPVEVKISPFLSTPSSWFARTFFSPPEYEELDSLSSGLKVGVFLEKMDEDGFTWEDPIPADVFRPAVDRLDVDETEPVPGRDPCQYLVISFPVEQSGKYLIELRYKGNEVEGSPFSAYMEACEVDPKKMRVSGHSKGTPFLILEGEPFILEIFPVDAYGNRCETTMNTLQRIRVISSDESRLDACVGQRREQGPSYTIRGSCSTKGRYTLQVFHNLDQIGDPIDLICLSEEEFTQVTEKRWSWKLTGKLLTFPEGQKMKVHFHSPGDNYNKDEYGQSAGNVLHQILEQQVEVEVTAKFLTIQERVLEGPSFTRVATFPLSRRTIEVRVVKEDLEDDTMLLELSDRPLVKKWRLLLKSDAGRILLSLCHQLSREEGRSLVQVMGPRRESLPRSIKFSFPERISLFNSKIQGTYEQYEGVFPSGLGFKTISVRRDSIINDTLKATEYFTRPDWAQPFAVMFRNEDETFSSEYDSSYEDWITSLLSTIFESSAVGPFLANRYTNPGTNIRKEGLLHPVPEGERKKDLDLAVYDLAGKAVAKLVLERILNPSSPRPKIPIRLSRTLYASLLRTRVKHAHLELDDPEGFESLAATILARTRSTDSVHSSEWICPAAVPIDLTAEARLVDPVRAEIEAFVNGVTFLIPDNLLMGFDEDELEILFFGSSHPLPPEFLEEGSWAFTASSWNPKFYEARSQLFQTLGEMDYVETGRFLQFISPSSILPQHPPNLKGLKPTLGLSAWFAQPPVGDRLTSKLVISKHQDYERFKAALLKAIA